MEKATPKVVFDVFFIPKWSARKYEKRALVRYLLQFKRFRKSATRHEVWGPQKAGRIDPRDELGPEPLRQGGRGHQRRSQSDAGAAKKPPGGSKMDPRIGK